MNWQSMHLANKTRHLLQVGHSSRDGGLELMQFKLWHRIPPASELLIVCYGVNIKCSYRSCQVAQDYDPESV